MPARLFPQKIANASLHKHYDLLECKGSSINWPNRGSALKQFRLAGPINFSQQSSLQIKLRGEIEFAYKGCN